MLSWIKQDLVKLFLQSDVGECSVDGIAVPAGKEGRVTRKENIREDSHWPHVWNTKHKYKILKKENSVEEPDPVEMSS